MYTPVNLKHWIDENRHLLKPPVSNKMVWTDDRESIIMIVGGPNKRNDYHINCTEEFFYQVEGDITLRIIHPETGKPHDVVIREGEIYLLPKDVPHSPIRPRNTIGLVIEQKRPAGVDDKLRWYCDNCNEVVYEDHFKLENIVDDLKILMERFWSNDELRTCKCGTKVTQPTEEPVPVPPLA